MNPRSLLPLLAILLAVGAVAPAVPRTGAATPDIRIAGQAATKDAINLSGLAAAGPQGKVFLRTLMADLERSGWFKVEMTGSTKVTGTITDAGASVQSACAVSWTGGSFPWSRGPGAADARREAHVFADEIVSRIKGVKGIACTRIILVRRAGTAAELYMCDADGQNMMQITHDNALCVGPRWTPDGRSAYYTSYVNGRPCAYRISTETAVKKMLSGYLGLNAGPVVSPKNGADVALILSFPGNPELFLLHLGDGALKRLTRTHKFSEASPCWSPDGREIAYVSDESGRAQIYIMDPATLRSRRATVTYGSENLSPSWSPDGKLIAYTSRRGGVYQVGVLDPARGEVRDALTSGAPHEDPSWAPDNRHLVCARRDGNASSIWIIDTLGDPEIRLFSLSGEWITPDWSQR
jgi:TolB protein